MTNRNRFFLGMTLLNLSFIGSLAFALDTSCHQSALDQLRRSSPEGYLTYQTVSNKASFTEWIKCQKSQSLQGDLSTAVHETVHMITADTDTYPTLNGKKLKRVSDTNEFYAPYLIASEFDKESTFVQTYLQKSGSSSGQYFRYLLDEFNAYAHDVVSSQKLRHLAKEGEVLQYRDGLSALMAFIATYIEKAKTDYAFSWRALQNPEVKNTIQTLWNQAEAVMEKTCEDKGVAYEAPGYLKRLCDKSKIQGLSLILGRSPKCFEKCISVDSESKKTNFDDNVDPQWEGGAQENDGDKADPVSDSDYRELGKMLAPSVR